jgi:hypothetical protein
MRAHSTTHTHAYQYETAATKCTGSRANKFIPFFQECGAVFLQEKQKKERSAIDRFYHTCTASQPPGQTGGTEQKALLLQRWSSTYVAMYSYQMINRFAED